ncbi:RIP metalloprotease RseP [Qingshengfaniella alkalisoli]|uniref:Zinc metalloprotease n=1 Tax=Qingshengfaniella alkalisoli TaxID=2599296 RepID=A0A5B8I8G0_9RHOB|nr:RIP metalloprotease RseP [Qingshengfaniella alkalisoli]
MAFLPSFGNTIYTLAAFVIALSVIVAIHEYGHYIVGRWCGIHAEVFSLGFGPQLANWTDKRGTRWQIAALPLGGYVRFLGDDDAASGMDEAAIRKMSAQDRRRTMHGAPLWARTATVAAGPIFNFVLSILVFASVMMVQGQATLPLTVDRISPLPTGAYELREGDEIRAIGGQDIDSFETLGTLTDLLPLSASIDYDVTRDGQGMTVQGPYPYPPLVASVSPQSAAMDAGLRKGDVIAEINGAPVVAFEQLREQVGGSQGDPVQLEIWRDGEIFSQELAPRVVDLPTQDGFEQRYLIGVTGGLVFEPDTQSPGPLSAIGQGAAQTWFIVEQSLSGLYHMITGAISSCNLSGPIGIAETSGDVARQGLISFIWFIAVLSTAVGMLNLFPVPVLDGGHLVFFAYEAIIGKPPSEKALRVLMSIGLALILTLMLFSVTNDLFCP